MIDDAPSLVGRVLMNRLELVELLGSGSMGQVYKANHLALDKPVAIKVMRTLAAPTAGQVRRFRAEAQASSRIDHPNSVQILDFGEDPTDRMLYIVMEFLVTAAAAKAAVLGALLKHERHLEEVRACRMMMQILAALAAAHDRGIIHRDVKPGNIMLVTKTGDDGIIPEFVKVCDFGIAKLLKPDEDEEPITMHGVALGTPAFAAPEQLMGHEVDGRADVYACGILLYCMLAGRRPFRGEAMEVAMKQISKEAEPIETVRASIDPRVAHVVRRAMAKRPGDRFQDARQMRNALKPLLGMIPNAVTTASWLSAAPTPQRWNPPTGSIPPQVPGHGPPMPQPPPYGSAPPGYPNQPGFGGNLNEPTPSLGLPIPNLPNLTPQTFSQREHTIPPPPPHPHHVRPRHHIDRAVPPLPGLRHNPPPSAVPPGQPVPYRMPPTPRPMSAEATHPPPMAAYPPPEYFAAPPTVPGQPPASLPPPRRPTSGTPPPPLPPRFPPGYGPPANPTTAPAPPPPPLPDDSGTEG